MIDLGNCRRMKKMGQKISSFCGMGGETVVGGNDLLPVEIEFENFFARGADHISVPVPYGAVPIAVPE